jgi:hypothetical protein
MSLIKALKGDYSTRKLEDIRDDFKQAFEAFISADEYSQEAVTTLVTLYTEYAVAYMVEISATLTEPKGASETMKFMNSIIAEMVNKADLHYFNQEHGFSIIDKSVQAALDAGQITVQQVMNIINEIEESYKEPESDEE